MQGIYKITNPEGKIYIGQSVDIELRLRYHKNSSRYSYLSRTDLIKSVEAYGWDCHIVEVVEQVEDESSLLERERYWQEHYKVLDEGLNMRLSESRDAYGRLSVEVKAKISRVSRNRSQEYRDKMSISMKGHTGGMRGKSHTEETKQKMSEAHKGAVKSKEHREALSNALKGRKFSEEHRKKLSEAQKGKKRPHISISNRKRSNH